MGEEVGGVTDGLNKGTKGLKAHNEGLIKNQNRSANSDPRLAAT